MHAFPWKQVTRIATTTFLSFPIVLVAQRVDEENKDDPAKASAMPISPEDRLTLHFEVYELIIERKDAPGRPDAGDTAEDWTPLVASKVADGAAELRYVFHEPVTVGERFSVDSSARTPIVRGRRVSPRTGEVQTQIEYSNVGCSIEVTPSWLDHSAADASSNPMLTGQWQVEMSDLVRKSGVQVAVDVPAPLFLRLKHEFAWTAHVGEDALGYHVLEQRADDAEADRFRCFAFKFRFDAPEGE